MLAISYSSDIIIGVREISPQTSKTYKEDTIMKKYTFSELVNIMEKNGANLAEVAIGRMMDIIEEETGDFPNWTDIAPEWVVNNCFGKKA